MSGTATASTGATLLADTGEAKVYHATWRDLLDVVQGCDLLTADAPYSEKTHKGHDFGSSSDVAKLTRRKLSYPPWDHDDVRAFVEAWSPRTRGWFVSITDDVLAPEWQHYLEAAGRYAFAPLPFVAPGSRVRLAGDGPSSWTTWIVVARPKTKEFSTWGTLPGAYVLPPGHGGAMPVVGGKPIWLGCALARDYSRPGDLICDPCAGAGTFGVGALREGRRAVVGDALLAHAEIAAAWVKRPHSPAPGLTEKPAPGQRLLFEATK